jgi:hypothetical protein
LLLSKAILQECKRPPQKKIEFGMDYQTAFDRVPHSWIIKSLELIGINNKVIAFTKEVMTYWRTRMRLHAENGLIDKEDKNTVWDISRRLTSTTAILRLFDTSH